MSTDIRGFQIEIPQPELDFLHDRLRTARLPEPETVSDWTQGIPLGYVSELCEYWRSSYDWRERESRINSYPQYLTQLDDLDIHFIHVESSIESARPLVLTHGWPGSIVEFLEVIEPLTEPIKHGGTEQDAFHLVIPSLPGFGFSAKPSQTGWNVNKIAKAWDELMVRLGYDQYLAQGGDWGAGITTSLAADHSDHCVGMHTNMATVGPDRDTLNDLQPIEEEAMRLTRRFTDRTSRLDLGKVLPVDRLRWTPRECNLTGLATGQRDVLLANRMRCFKWQDLLGELWQGWIRKPGDGAFRHHRVPKRNF